MPRRKKAYIWINAGTFHAVEYPSQRHICSNVRLRDAVYRARRKGFDVRIYGNGTSRVVKAFDRPTPRS
jgi:hypothetical protein